MKTSVRRFETYEFSQGFEIGSLLIAPVHVRIEQLRPFIAAHRHSRVSYEIHYTAEGQGTVIVKGEELPVKKGVLYITGPGVVHTQISNTDDPVIEYCLYLNCRKKQTAPAGLFSLFADTLFWYGRDDGSIFSLLVQLIDENKNQRPDTWIMSESILKQLIVTLTRKYRSDASGTPGAHMPFPLTKEGKIPLMEDAFFYRYRTLTIHDLSAQMHLSVRQTQRLIQSHFGKSFSQKLSEARMAAAEQLLAYSDLSVTAISEQMGFSSIEHFSAAFKRAAGMSPREYRRAEKNKKRPEDPAGL